MKRLSKILLSSYCSLSVGIFSSILSFAAPGDVSGAKAGADAIKTSVKDLADYAASWLIGIAVGVSGCLIGYQALMKMLSDGDDVGVRNKNMKRILVSGVLVAVAGTITKLVLAFFTNVT